MGATDYVAQRRPGIGLRYHERGASGPFGNGVARTIERRRAWRNAAGFLAAGRSLRRFPCRKQWVSFASRRKLSGERGQLILAEDQPLHCTPVADRFGQRSQVVVADVEVLQRTSPPMDSGSAVSWFSWRVNRRKADGSPKLGGRERNRLPCRWSDLEPLKPADFVWEDFQLIRGKIELLQ